LGWRKLNVDDLPSYQHIVMRISYNVYNYCYYTVEHHPYTIDGFLTRPERRGK